MQDSSGLGTRHRVLERLAESRAPPRVVRDPNVDALLLERGDPVERQHRVRDGTAALGIEELDRHQLYSPIDPGHADSVAGHRTDRSRDVRSVPEVVGPSADALATHARESVRSVRVRPQVGAKVRVREIDPRVDDRHDHRARIRLNVPGRGGRNLRHVPLLIPQRIRGE